jgi:chlorobactene glucosyltransferase
MGDLSSNTVGISAIVPARNEQEVIAVCVASLTAQQEISEVLVVNDQSSDATAQIVRELEQEFPQVRRLDTTELPAGWVGKNYAVWLGAQAAQGDWLLFTDADATHEPNSAATALEMAGQFDADLVSLSPEQVVETWYEKALIPYVYTRLSRLFTFEEVNDPRNSAAAANGQFLLIRREVYERIGGHASVASEVLEDVALAKRVKAAGYRIWFCSGKGIVRVRMYRTFDAMWQGWRKNLYRLVGGTSAALRKELTSVLAPAGLAIMAALVVVALTGSWLVTLTVLILEVAIVLATYASELTRNGFPASLALYGLPGRLLYAGALWASYQSYRRGRLQWKGREYPVTTPGASNIGKN